MYVCMNPIPPLKTRCWDGMGMMGSNVSVSGVEVFPFTVARNLYIIKIIFILPTILPIHDEY